MEMKWFVALLMVVVMVCACWTGAAAENERDYQYALLDDGTIEITRYKGSADRLAIPAKIAGKTVTSIRYSAFYSCDSLTSVSIPDSVEQIGTNLFVGCSKLKTISVSPDHPYFATIDGVLFRKADKALISYPAGIKSSTYTIPQGIAVIGDSAFFACSSLTSVSVPDSVTSIGDEAFALCSSLTSVSIPDSVTSIGDAAFHSCKSLTSVSIPNSVTSIGDAAFFSCDSLTSVSIPDSVTSIGDLAFRFCDSLTSVSIPDSVEQIGTNPFADCSALKTISVSPEHLYFATIDGVLFRKADKALISYPAGIKSSTYTIPQGIASIGDYAFDSCTSLTSVSIPDSVTSIGDYAFDSCTSLTSVSIPDSVTSIGDYAFDNCPNLTLTVPRNSYAAEYAKTNNIPYTYPDANDWLNN